MYILKESKDTNNSKALKAGIWYIFCNALIKGITVLTVPIFTRVLTTYDFGIYSTFQSWLGIVTVVVTLDLYTSIQKARLDLDGDIDGFISSILFLSSISTAGFFLLVLCIGDKALSIFNLDKLLIVIMFIYNIIYPAFIFLQTKHRVYLHYKMFVLLSVTTSVLSVILSLLFVTNINGNKYTGRIIGGLLPGFVCSIIIYIIIMKRGKKLVNIKYWKYALGISVPLIPHHISGNILVYFDRIIIQQLNGASDAGLYSLAYSYGMIISIVVTSFNNAWAPWFYLKVHNSEFDEINKVSKPYILSFSIFTLCILLITPEAIKIMAPKEYWSSIWVVPPIVLGIFFQFLYTLYVNIEFYHKKSIYITIGTVTAAIINVVLNFACIPIFGYKCAAYTTLASYCILLIMHYFISGFILRVIIYDIRFIIKSIVIMLTATALVTISYNFIVLRYLALTVIISLSVIHFKKTNIISLFSHSK